MFVKSSCGHVCRMSVWLPEFLKRHLRLKYIGRHFVDRTCKCSRTGGGEGYGQKERIQWETTKLRAELRVWRVRRSMVHNRWRVINQYKPFTQYKQLTVGSLSSATCPPIFMQLTGQNNGEIARSAFSIGQKKQLTGQNMHNEHA